MTPAGLPWHACVAISHATWACWRLNDVAGRDTGVSCVCFSAMAPAPADVNEPVRARGTMSRACLPDRRVADRVASADFSEEGLEEGLASASRPSSEGSQAQHLPTVVGGSTGT